MPPLKRRRDDESDIGLHRDIHLKSIPPLKRRREDSDIGPYKDQHFKGTREEQEDKMKVSKTLYVGNLSFHTSEEQVIEFFSMAGDVHRVIMGLDRYKKTPCGFCFVEYSERKDAEMAMKYLNGTRLDERSIRTDWDAGFEEGRQYGRGRAGGQVREEYRTNYDPARGGYGQIVKRKCHHAKRRER